MRDALMRLVALASLAAVADMLAADGGAKQAVRFIGGVLTAGVMLDAALSILEAW